MAAHTTALQKSPASPSHQDLSELDRVRHADRGVPLGGVPHVVSQWLSGQVVAPPPRAALLGRVLGALALALTSSLPDIFGPLAGSGLSLRGRKRAGDRRHAAELAADHQMTARSSPAGPAAAANHAEAPHAGSAGGVAARGLAGARVAGPVRLIPVPIPVRRLSASAAPLRWRCDRSPARSRPPARPRGRSRHTGRWSTRMPHTAHRLH